MSINRLLVLAGLLAIGACGNPGPTAICVVDPALDTEETLCTPDHSASGSTVSLPEDNLSDASVED